MRTGWVVVSASRPVTVKVSTVVVRSGTATSVRRRFGPIATAFNPTYVSRDAEACVSALLAMTDAAKNDAGLNRRGRGQ